MGFVALLTAIATDAHRARSPARLRFAGARTTGVRERARWYTPWPPLPIARNAPRRCYSPRVTHRLLPTLLIFVALAIVGPTSAQQGGSTDAPLRADEIRARLQSLGENDSALAAQYREALTHLETADAATARAVEARRQAAEAPAKLDAIRAELARPSQAPIPSAPADATLATLEQSEAQAVAELNAARDLVNELQAETTRRQDRRVQIPEQLAQARQRLETLNAALDSARSEGESAEAWEARRTLLLARRAAEGAEIEALEAELASDEARRDLLPARRDRAARRVSDGEKAVRAWQELVSAKRTSEAEQTAREAERLRRQAARQHPALQAYAAENERLAASRTQPDGAPQRITQAAREVAEARSRLSDLRQQYTAARRRIEASGFNRATGLLLRRQYESLPDLRDLRRHVSAVQDALEAAEYALILRQEEQAGSGDIERVTQELLDEIDPSDAVRGDIEAAARELAVGRRDLLNEMAKDASRLSEVLFELDAVSRDLLAAATAYEAFIRERILWVRSIAGNRFPSLSDFHDTAEWLLDPGAWRETLSRSRRDVERRDPLVIVAIIGLIALFVLSRVARRHNKRLGQFVASYRTDAMVYSFVSLGLTVLMSLPLAVVVWWAGWVLVRPPDQVELGITVGAGLQGAAILLIPFLILRHTVRAGGLADAHFRWPSKALVLVRRQLRWFIPVVVPMTAIAIAMDRHTDEAAASSFGRLAFTVAMGAFAVFLHRVVRPRGALVGELLRNNPDSWFARLKALWHPLIIAAPVTLIVIAWLGYFYTAMQLAAHIERTLVFALALVLINGMLLRWLFVARRRVAIEDARRRREQAAQSDPSTENTPTEATLQPLDEDKLNLPTISLQTRQLFRVAVFVASVVGLYVIWASVLPALRILDRVEVYPELRVEASHETESIPILHSAAVYTPARTTTPTTSPQASETQPSNAAPVSPLQQLSASDAPPDGEEPAPASRAVTLADIGLGILVLLATLIAFRNLPGLVEIMILQRLPLDAGSRYALSTVLRYAIAIIGVAIAFSVVNISWSKVQWLAAALTFGLAFGLQEIFANFVSGLIILGERPIRMGDTVTVGGVTGTVTRIRMRATTIADWDRKELVIPNKNFITGEVINWSLSDPVLRVVINVGVSYEADVRKAEAMLLRVASEQPVVLEEPAPYVAFNRFGDSTLDFELRVFIPSIEHLISVRHDLHMRITELFRAEDIEIAFPQRDLHLRSIDGDVRAAIAPERAD